MDSSSSSDGIPCSALEEYCHLIGHGRTQRRGSCPADHSVLSGEFQWQLLWSNEWIMTVIWTRNRKLQWEFYAIEQQITHGVDGSSSHRQLLTVWWNIFIHDLFSFLQMKLSVDIFKQKLSSFYFLSTAECFCSTKMTNEIPPKNWRTIDEEALLSSVLCVSRICWPSIYFACVFASSLDFFAFLSQRPAVKRDTQVASEQIKTKKLNIKKKKKEKKKNCSYHFYVWFTNIPSCCSWI
jgi:hypothetical protein